MRGRILDPSPDHAPDDAQLSASIDIAFAMAGDVHRNARALRQLGALSAAGYSVTVVCLPGTDVHSRLPAGVHVVPVPVVGSGGPAFFWRLHRQMTAALRRIPARLFHASDLYVLTAVRSAARRAHRPFTYDARELYTHVAATVGRPHVRAAWRLVEGQSITRARHVWTVSESIAAHLERAYRIARPSVQLNAPAVTLAPAASPWLREQAGIPSTSPVILHLGQLRKDRGADALLDAMAHWPPDAPRAHLVFLGYGPERARLEAQVQTSQLARRVHFISAIPPADLPAVVAGADAGVTLLEPTCLNHRYALPNKLFDYLLAGLPVVASDLPECAAVVQHYDCGVTADPNNRRALINALVQVSARNGQTEAWGRNARAAAETLDWNTASSAFTDQVGALLPT